MSLTKPFSKREKIMMLVLSLIMVALVYYRFVYVPAADDIQEYESKKSEAENQMVTETAKQLSIQKMLREIEQYEGENVADIPDYDNKNNVLIELYSVLSKTDKYDTVFLATSEAKDGIVRRPIDITFETTGFESAKMIIEELNDGRFRNIISNLSIRPSSGNDSDISTSNIRITLRITYFEKVITVEE